MGRTSRIWKARKTDDSVVRGLCLALGLREPVGRLLAHRGIVDEKAAEIHLSGKLSGLPDPFLLKGMQATVERIEKAIEQGEKIVAWGDYDVDGMTSISLLVHFFRDIPYPIQPAIPRRLEDGYGLQSYSVEEMAADGVKLIITVDNGISSHDEISLAEKLGVDVIVIDHHEPEGGLPKAAAIIDPKQPGCRFVQNDLAAVGLTFMTLAGLRRHLVQKGLLARENAPNLKRLLDIVALGTVADMVPLMGVNRLFVRHGLPILSRSLRPGILALKEVARLDPDAEIDSFSIGFMLAPRLNAGGRLKDAMSGMRLLTTEHLAEARQEAKVLDLCNDARRKIQETVTDEALELVEQDSSMPDGPAIVVARQGWHEGVIGLAASRLVERYYRPTIVLTVNEEGMARASCRSIEALHMQETLSELSDYLERFGGHKQAAGFSIRAERIAEFREAFNKAVAEKLKPDDFIPLLHTDGECSLNQIDFTLLDQIERLAPFGIGHSEPLFVARQVLVERARLIKGKHWKLGLSDGSRRLDAIGFSMGEKPLQRGDLLDIAYVPEYNNYKGVKSIQLRLKDVKWSEGYERENGD